MAHVKFSDQEILERAADVFRKYGFEGTSLTRLVEATGLEKASLYYHYPGGKEEIAVAVAAHITDWFAKNVIAPLKQDGPPPRRLQAAIRRLREFYQDGARSCMLDTLSLQGGGPALAAALQVASTGLLEAFAAVARASGMRKHLATRRAEQAIIHIEGALVLSRVTADNKPFLRVMSGLPGLLLQPVA
jgi:AcrR family transcriptional regulator